MGLRKIPPAGRERLRIIEIADFDLCACGGTHVRSTGQTGAILLRKVEKVKQGMRVEFVCGERAVRFARKDYETLVEAAGLYSAQLWTAPEQIRKSLEELKTAAKREHKLLEEVAELTAANMLAASELSGGIRLITQVLTGRDLAFAKMLAQKLVAEPLTVAVLGCGTEQPALVFAEWRGGPFDMGALMKQEMARLGSRGGGSRELAQGGVPGLEQLADAIERAKAAILSQCSSATPAPASQPR
jgi:alanyl-tRNA synthetase